MAINKLEKVYNVTFIEYTNVLKDTVSDWDGSYNTAANARYLDVSRESFLLRESDLEKYRKFGKGYRNIVFAGYMPVDESIGLDASKIGTLEIDKNPHDDNLKYSTGTPFPEHFATISCTSKAQEDPTKITTAWNANSKE